MPVLIHTGPQGRKSLCDFPLCLLVEGSAPSPFEHRISFCGYAVSVPLRSALNGHPPDVQCLRTLLTRTSLPLAVVFFFQHPVLPPFSALNLHLPLPLKAPAFPHGNAGTQHRSFSFLPAISRTPSATL